MSLQVVHTTTFTAACDHCEKSVTWDVEGSQDFSPVPEGWLSYRIAMPADSPMKGSLVFCTKDCALDGFVIRLRAAHPPTQRTDPLNRLIAL